jgi:hypothetical protein
MPCRIPILKWIITHINTSAPISSAKAAKTTPKALTKPATNSPALCQQWWRCYHRGSSVRSWEFGLCRCTLGCWIVGGWDRGTETQQSTTDFNANGNLLTLNNIGTLHWYYNNTLNQVTKADKSNTTQYYVYNYRGRRVRTVIESVAFLLDLGFVFASNDGGATIGVVVFVAEGLGFVVAL